MSVEMPGCAIDECPDVDARLDEDELDFAVTTFAALASPTRLRMIHMMARGERTVNDFVRQLNVLQPNASQNLSVLHKAGLVKMTPHRQERYYSLQGGVLERINAALRAFPHESRDA